MKVAILKVMVVCVIAISLFAVGATATTTLDAGVSLCRHDGPHGGAGGQ